MRKVTKRSGNRTMVLPPGYFAALGDLAPMAKAMPAEPAAAKPEISTRSITAVFTCIQTLAGSGRDLGKDATFIGSTAKRLELNASQAAACRLFVGRYRNQLPAELAADAMGERDAAPITAKLSVAAASTKRNPPLKSAGRPMTPSERQARWRASRAMAAVEVPGAIAECLRAAREAHGGISTAELLKMALDALEREKELPHRSRTNVR